VIICGSVFMPELPEVQTVVNDLNKKIVGYTVADFWSDWPKAIKVKSLAEFTKEIRGRKILQARRIGKNIFIDLSGGKTLYIHLKMTGHLLVKRQNVKTSKRQEKESYFNDKVNQYIHHIWKLKADTKQRNKFESTKNNKFVDSCAFVGSDRTMEFSDVRKFAKIVLDDTQKINALSEIKKLGVDALSQQFTFAKFSEILNRNSAKGRSAFGGKTIGSVLMNQELIAGIGNIYRSEILYAANVLPHRKISSLKRDEIKKIYKHIAVILKKAVRMRGTSDSDYRDTAGAPGNFQKVLQVYRRTGKKCPKCATIIKKSTLEQRSVFYCPKCQK
jgi:formamidopyrimidine-DNA glycosylase